MDFVYTPKGATEKRWEFLADDLMSDEAELIEQHSGMTFEQWKGAVQAGSMRALHALLFVLLKRENAQLKYAQVLFRKSEVEFQLSSDAERDEWIEALAELEKADKLDADQAALLASLRADAGGDEDETPASEDTVPGQVVDVPKATSARARKSA